ncbi:MAG: RNA polymerase sigma factor RpoE [Immundisolibacter sp.]|uniref:RNA polymerase sigma factor RpoE n=1 Tax=Immundisolibacter sp. TaxID=1934948 RepID=UPI003D0D8321
MNDNDYEKPADDSAVDLALVRRVQRGDKRAFDLLVSKYQLRLAKLVGRLVSDRAEAQDVVQEAFIKAYRALPNFRGDSAFYTWLYRIAVNAAKNHLVARSRRPPTADVDITDGDVEEAGVLMADVATPESYAARDQLQAALAQALAELPEDLRTALTLCEMEGLSYDEIAQVLDCPIGTVRSRIFRARRALDVKLKPFL